LSGDPPNDEESDFLGMVSVRRKYQFFAVAKSNFGLAALILQRKRLRFVILAIADKILSEENRFQLFDLHIRAFALLGVLFK